MKALFFKVQVLLLLVCLMVVGVSYYQQSQAFGPMKVSLSNLTRDAKQQVYCLAENIYFEARQEPEMGKLAVAFVTQNRVERGFGNSICEVVKQKANGVCQFSWWCEPTPHAISTSKSLTKTSDREYNEILKLALHFYVNHERLQDPTKGALFYHADYVNPGWRLPKITKIGRHIFYGDKSYGRA